MKTKKLKQLMGLMIVISTIMTILPAVMAAPDTVTVRFVDTGNGTYIVPDCVPPLAFDVEIVLETTDMLGWAIPDPILFNKDVLEVTAVTTGPFAPAGGAVLSVIDNVNGEIRGTTMYTATPGAAPVSGTGVVAIISFNCIATGASSIDINSFVVIAEDSSETTVTPITSANFECQAYIGPPTPPTASFTPATCNQFRLDAATNQVTVDFDASASTGSYDSLPEGGETSNPIAEYAWDFDGDMVVDQVSSNYVVAIDVADIETYYDAEAEYFMGWNCKVEWNPSALTFVGYEEGPLTAGFDSVIIGVESPAGVLLSFAMGALEEVPVASLTGSGTLAYLYFSNPVPECAGTTESVTISEEIIASYNNTANGGSRQIYEVSATFTPAYSYQTPSPLASYTYDTVGDVAITLWVYAPDCNDAETNPLFVDNAEVTNLIHILPPIQGADIDVYTERGGEGKGCDKITGVEMGPYAESPEYAAMSDAFGPQEAVTVCALVTYNQEPVANKLVAFDVRDPDGQLIATRTASTNANGVACVEFRIPWQGTSAEDLFGLWLITATVDVSEVHVIDKCRFHFGYLVSCTGINLNPASVAKQSSVGVELDLANLQFSSEDVFVTIVIYDEASVPIANFVSWVTVPEVGTTTPEASMSIPKWAFVGVGTVYANVFNNKPKLGGTAMCPEVSETLVITPAP